MWKDQHLHSTVANRQRRWLAAFSVTLLMTACAGTPSTVPQRTPQLEAALEKPKFCKWPAPATRDIGPDWKYGCFCGKGHPPIKPEMTTHLSEKERYDVIAKYYRIKPIDAIDEACQFHDVCWVLNGRAESVCNGVFASRLRDLEDRFERAGKTDQVKMKCGVLARDMLLFSYAFLEADNVSPSDQQTLFLLSVAQLSSFLLALAHAAFELPYTVLGIVPYPAVHERCVE